MKKLSLKNVESMLSRNEMRVISGGYGSGGTCLAACSPASKNSDCCSGMTVSGDYPPCGTKGPRVCI